MTCGPWNITSQYITRWWNGVQRICSSIDDLRLRTPWRVIRSTERSFWSSSSLLFETCSMPWLDFVFLSVIMFLLRRIGFSTCSGEDISPGSFLISFSWWRISPIRRVFDGMVLGWSHLNLNSHIISQRSFWKVSVQKFVYSMSWCFKHTTLAGRTICVKYLCDPHHQWTWLLTHHRVVFGKNQLQVKSESHQSLHIWFVPVKCFCRIKLAEFWTWFGWSDGTSFG